MMKQFSTLHGERPEPPQEPFKDRMAGWLGFALVCVLIGAPALVALISWVVMFVSDYGRLFP